jgi:sodium-dependent dicarboxylate transporter 2/3/5
MFLGPPGGMSEDARRVASTALWMGVWWLSVPVALEVTSLLPLVLLPVLGVASIEAAAAPYANSVIFLFLGGFFLAAAMERWGLHRRVALTVLGLVGTDARRVILAFMAATAFLSMWISNTATAVMMMPLATAVLASSPAAGRPAGFGTALVLGVAYAASVGGMATLIGTPPNAIFAATAEQLFGHRVSFTDWMAVGLPAVLLLLPVFWWMLTGPLFRVRGEITGLAETLRVEKAALGPLAGAERLTLWVFALAAAAWFAREPKTLGELEVPGLTSLVPGLSDAGIAIAAAVLLFSLPVSLKREEFALDWETARKVPWGILLVFGGGLSVAEAFQSSGLSEWIGGLIGGFGGLPDAGLFAAVSAVFVALGEFASNTAMAAMAMPLLAGVAPALGQEPLELMQLVALAASIGFMLPVATPPNAIAFATGEVTVGQMARAGLWLDVIAVVVLAVVAVGAFGV